MERKDRELYLLQCNGPNNFKRFTAELELVSELYNYRGDIDLLFVSEDCAHPLVRRFCERESVPVAEVHNHLDAFDDILTRNYGVFVYFVGPDVDLDLLGANSSDMGIISESRTRTKY